MELFHVSYKKIDSFTPRIPQSRADGENASVPRICFAETIEQCVNAKPSGLGPILSGLMNNLPVLLYVYSIHTEDYPAELLLPPISVYENLSCKDALANCEYALLCRPKEVRERTFLVQDILLRQDGYSLRKLYLEENPQDTNAYIVERLTNIINTTVLSSEPVQPEQLLLQMPENLKVALQRYLSAKEILREQEKEAHDHKVAMIVPGTVLEGTVESLQPYGAFVDLKDGLSGLVHISQICQRRIKKPSEVLKVGDKVKVKVLNTNEGKISLSIKAAQELEAEEVESFDTASFSNREEVGTSLGDLFKKLGL